MIVPPPSDPASGAAVWIRVAWGSYDQVFVTPKCSYTVAASSHEALLRVGAPPATSGATGTPAAAAGRRASLVLVLAAVLAAAGSLRGRA